MNAWKFPGGLSDPGENIGECLKTNTVHLAKSFRFSVMLKIIHSFELYKIRHMIYAKNYIHVSIFTFFFVLHFKSSFNILYVTQPPKQRLSLQKIYVFPPHLDISLKGD